MTLEQFNQQPSSETKQQLFQCCGSISWVEMMLKEVPFSSAKDLQEKADRCWSKTNDEDWKEAFTHHPMIGDIDSLRKKFASTQHWTTGEQSNVAKADDAVLVELKSMNEKYFDKFGFIFIICATGKSATEMLTVLKERINNTIEEELTIAAEEQRKIMQLRILKLLQ